MKRLKLLTIVMMCLASVIFYSCDRFPIGGDEPSKEEPAVLKYVESVEWIVTDMEGNVKPSRGEYMKYKYDEKMRIARVEIYKSKDDDSKRELSETYSLDYSILDEVSVTHSYVNNSDYDRTWVYTMKNGRAVEKVYESGYTQKYLYDEKGHLEQVEDYRDGKREMILSLSHSEEGLLYRVNADTGYGDEYEDFDIEKCYPNRYENKNTNVDINYFLQFSMYLTDPLHGTDFLGLVGKLSDCYVEGIESGKYYSPAEGHGDTYDPNHKETYVSVSYECLSDSFHPFIYEFDEDGCPVKITTEDLYKKTVITCELVASSTPINPEAPKEEWRYEIIEKSRSEKDLGTFKSTDTIVITYR